MAMILPFSTKRFWRLAWRTALLILALAVAILGGFAVYAVETLPALKPWHTEVLAEEFSARRDGHLDFAGYLKLEDRLFAEMRAKVALWDATDEAYVYSRFNPASHANRLAAGAPFNRSFRLRHPKAAGHALLMHGLTDSPYSMKALAESLHSRGFEVTVLRMPGHGTFPSMMTQMSVADWTAALRIAARDVASRARPHQPFYIGGYSTGGTLALQYTLDALADSSLRKPDRVMLISPAIEVTRLAVISNLLEFFTIIPVPPLQKARWQGIGVEYDPYKFNSFPINATQQVNRATRLLQSGLKRASETERIAQMPPVIAWQSAVDSTVGANGVVSLLFARLRGPQHRLVLFDVNRHDALGSVQRPGAGALVKRLASEPRGYTLDIVSNANSRGRHVGVRQMAPNGAVSMRGTTLAWPETLVSVGHVALPFRPDDPVYGVNPGSGHAGLPSIGTWLFRGESGAVTVDLGSLTRPRSNPFWPLIDEGVGAAVEADLAGLRR